MTNPTRSDSTPRHTETPRPEPPSSRTKGHRPGDSGADAVFILHVIDGLLYEHCPTDADPLVLLQIAELVRGWIDEKAASS